MMFQGHDPLEFTTKEGLLVLYLGRFSRCIMKQVHHEVLINFYGIQKIIFSSILFIKSHFQFILPMRILERERKADTTYQGLERSYPFPKPCVSLH